MDTLLPLKSEMRNTKRNLFKSLDSRDLIRKARNCDLNELIDDQRHIRDESHLQSATSYTDAFFRACGLAKSGLKLAERPLVNQSSDYESAKTGRRY